MRLTLRLDSSSSKITIPCLNTQPKPCLCVVIEGLTMSEKWRLGVYLSGGLMALMAAPFATAADYEFSWTGSNRRTPMTATRNDAIKFSAAECIYIPVS